MHAHASMQASRDLAFVVSHHNHQLKLVELELKEGAYSLAAYLAVTSAIQLPACLLLSVFAITPALVGVMNCPGHVFGPLLLSMTGAVWVRAAPSGPAVDPSRRPSLLLVLFRPSSSVLGMHGTAPLSSSPVSLSP